mmetsp:Transcript_58531/g.95254  ORF Transcript_58531/g.95254 Transcript_58531/m.95254 type:complete len:207 (-) Transcript_58531:366-986(-)
MFLATLDTTLVDLHILIPVGSRLFMRHPQGMSQLMQHGAHRIAARGLQVQTLRLAMGQLSHVGPTALVFRSDEHSRRFLTLIARPASKLFELDTRHRLLVLINGQTDCILYTIWDVLVVAELHDAFGPGLSSTEASVLLPCDLLSRLGVAHEIPQLLLVVRHHVTLEGAFFGILQVELVAMRPGDPQDARDVVRGDFDADLGSNLW